jgi:predicted ABC-type ATPase
MDPRQQPRLRIFAGPNGSGKSTIINSIRDYKVNGRTVDFGYYINADDIALALQTTGIYSFKQFEFEAKTDEFNSIVSDSGLLSKDFNLFQLTDTCKIADNAIHCIRKDQTERMAQIVADYLRKKLLKEQKRFSFETVFSHRSKLAIMEEAAGLGYKIYLYFVCTESPKINTFRVEARLKKGGHGIPVDKIEPRYYRAPELLHEAAQLAYQAFFFDNSEEGSDFKIFAHFKVVAGKKVWDDIDEAQIPNWFKKYYSEKVAKA